MSRFCHYSGVIVALMLASGTACAVESGGWKLDVNGNFQYDFAEFDADTATLDDADAVRRSRVAVTLKYLKQFELKAEFDLFANQWTDGYLQYRFADRQGFRVGQFKQPFFLDELTSDKNLLFMEQGLPAAMGIGRRIGAEYAYSAPTWSLALTQFGQTLAGGNDGEGFAARMTWLPISGDDSFLHLAAAVAIERPDSATARFSTRPEAGLSPRRFVDTGTVSGVNRIHRVGIEAAWVRGRWLLQSEYVQGLFSRNNAEDFSGSGYYVESSWFATDHRRGYKNGAIDAPMIEAGKPAWELGLRYSHLDLNDGSVLGGTESNWTAGVSCWLHPQLRLMANYIDVQSNRRGVTDNPDVLQLRAQLTF